jgi:hypothetical protein
VANIVKDFHNTRGQNVDVYTFSALEPSRKKLYDVLAKKMLFTLPHGQWFLDTDDSINDGKSYVFRKIEKGLKEAYDSMTPYGSVDRKRIAYNQIVDFVKNLPRKFARFIITPDDKIWISDGHRYIHYEISTGSSDHLDMGISDVNKKFIKHTKWVGVVDMHHDDEKFFDITKVNKNGNYNWNRNEKLDGKAKLLVDYLMKHGFERQDGWDV